jgi:Zn-dependent protease
MYDPWDDMRVLNPGFGKRRFSPTEIRDIAIAVGVLSVAFFVILYDRSYFSDDRTTNFIAIFGLALLLVLLSFMVHELAHKVTAQRYGAWAEFRMYPQGLLMALVFSMFGFLFAAPGAVYISGAIDRARNGKISAAGPASNLIIAAVASVLWYTTEGLTSDIFGLFAFVNAFFAVFNMLPIAPMDGSKIYPWNMPVYVMMFAAGAAMLVIQFTQ